ncbi:MAG: cupin domain-containing protein [Candidatus Fermentibacter sp.]|nr:cupin domain-containing protein [Candidatus Fermentibacter sp.]
MKYARPEEVGRVETPHGIEARRIHENDHVQVMYLKLAPGEALKPHTTPVDVFFYVLEGRGEVSIGAETVEVEAETIVDSPKGIGHCWRNTGNVTLRLLVVKTPKPGAQATMR